MTRNSRLLLGCQAPATNFQMMVAAPSQLADGQAPGSSNQLAAAPRPGSRLQQPTGGGSQAPAPSGGCSLATHRCQAPASNQNCNWQLLPRNSQMPGSPRNSQMPGSSNQNCNWQLLPRNSQMAGWQAQAIRLRSSTDFEPLLRLWSRGIKANS